MTMGTPNFEATHTGPAGKATLAEGHAKFAAESSICLVILGLYWGYMSCSLNS